jgi:hypothetical protein
VQITDTNDLLALTHSEDEYRLFLINLDAYDLTHFEETQNDPESLFYCGQRKPIFKYKESDVGDKKLVQMHCRGSSHKREIDFDDRLLVFLLHEDHLYSWVQQNHFESHFDLQPAKIRFVSTVSSELRIESESQLYFKSDSTVSQGSGTSLEMIMQLNINYCSYEILTIYVDSDVKDTILAFDVDQDTQKIMIVCESFGATDNQPFYTFKIYNILRADIDFSMVIKNEEVVGRLISGLYTFVNGHIYFNNNVIKIRYDLLNL